MRVARDLPFLLLLSLPWLFRSPGFSLPLPFPFNRPLLSSRAQSRDLLWAFLLPRIFTELQHRMSRGTWVSIAAASLPRVTLLPFLLKEWSLCVSDAGAHVEICGGRKAQSRSLDCARDDKKGGRWLGRGVSGGRGTLCCPGAPLRVARDLPFLLLLSLPWLFRSPAFSLQPPLLSSRAQSMDYKGED